MGQTDPRGRVVLHPGLRFNGVKVFSTTVAEDRSQLGDQVTAWITAHRDCTVTEIVVTQSSHGEYHCIAMTVFYFQPT